MEKDIPKIIAYGIAIIICFVALSSLMPYVIWGMGLLIAYYIHLQIKHK